MQPFENEHGSPEKAADQYIKSLRGEGTIRQATYTGTTKSPQDKSVAAVSYKVTAIIRGKMVSDQAVYAFVYDRGDGFWFISPVTQEGVLHLGIPHFPVNGKQESPSSNVVQCSRCKSAGTVICSQCKGTGDPIRVPTGGGNLNRVLEAIQQNANLRARGIYCGLCKNPSGKMKCDLCKGTGVANGEGNALASSGPEAGAAVNIEGQLTKGGKPSIYRERFRRGKTYLICIKCSNMKQLHPPLQVLDEFGKELARNEPADGGLIARLTFQAPRDGVFQIVASSSNDMAEGPFTLTIHEKEN